MISTDITGAGDGSTAQLFNLLNLVSNPEVHAARLKELTEATEEHKKQVALVGPATEILSLKEQVASDKAEAAKVLLEAQTEATRLVDEAKEQASSIVSGATQTADAMKLAADEVQKGTALARLSLDVQIKQVAEQQEKLKTSEKYYTDRLALIEEMEAQLKDEKVVVQNLKDELNARVKAFAESIA